MLKNSLILCLIFTLFSCSSLTDDDGIFRDRKKDYKKAEMTSRMVVPEDLDDQAIIDFHVIPEISPYAEEESFEKVPLPTDMIGQSDAAVKIQKMGDVQWILLQIPASRVWPRLKEFISLQEMAITLENSSAGIIEATKPDGVYRFQLGQGFQRNTSELSIRFLFSSADSKGFWPEASSDVAKEYEMVETIAQFFADVSDKPAYSFAAQGISAQKQLLIETSENGTKSLLLNVSKQRALVAIRLGLESADFTIDDFDSAKNGFKVQYTPQLAEDDQPGFFMSLFFKRKPFDKDVEYAGNKYVFTVDEQKGLYRVTVKAIDSEAPDEKLLRKELNKQIMLLKGHLH